MNSDYDVVVIGAGLIGSAIARELLGYRLRVAIVEARDDVGDGTSKANTAILHTGFDAKPGTLESRLVRRGYQLLSEYAQHTGIPVERTGALLVAWTPDELATLPALRERAEQNGYRHCELVDADEVYRQVPALGAGALGGLTVPDESVTCTWTTTLALATEARLRGADLLLGHRVTGIRHGTGTTTLLTSGGEIRAGWVINAAGLGADAIDAMYGYHRFTVTPRRGELLVFDKLARPLVDRIVLPVPSKAGKGVLISPTIYGNVMLGPTAEDLTDRAATGTSAAGFAFLLGHGARLMPRLLAEEVTASYAGLRAAIDRDDYLIEVDAGQRYLLVGGIRSTGLTSSMAVAEHVRELLAEAGPELIPRADRPAPPRLPNLGERSGRPYQDGERIAADPEYGRLVCFCERVSAGEIRDAVRSVIPPAGPDGLRRRTRALNGRCQGFYCAAAVGAELDAATPPAGPPTGPPAAPPTEPPTGPDRSSPGRTASRWRPEVLRPEVLIVGAGPAGLAAAAELARPGRGEILVLERELEAGGIPRHSHHTGFGLRDLHRLLAGPAYARRLLDRATTAGAVIRTGAMVTGWAEDGSAEVTSPAGWFRVDARAVLIATGARERPRSARLVPGDRPAGVFTTGQLQNHVHAARGRPGHRAVVVGAELVSWSAVLTLRSAGCRTLLITSEQPTAEGYAALTLAGRFGLRVPVATRTRVVGLIGATGGPGGGGRLQAVELECLDTGARRRVECDTVVFTGDWIPDHELLRAAGIDLDPASLGPVVDSSGRTSRPGIFAAGNLLHPVDTADVAALGGRQVAGQVRAWLDGTRPSGPALRLLAADPFRWVYPGLIRPGDPAPARHRLLLSSTRLVRAPRVTVSQGGQAIARRRLPWPASPGRLFRVPWGLLAGVDPSRGDVTIGLS